MDGASQVRQAAAPGRACHSWLWEQEAAVPMACPMDRFWLRANPHVKMQPIFDGLAFGNALEEQLPSKAFAANLSARLPADEFRFAASSTSLGTTALLYTKP
jgi:hypothetical protein